MANLGWPVIVAAAFLGSRQATLASAPEEMLGEAPAAMTEEPASAERTEEGFQWKPALWQSLLMLAVQHAGRMAQENTRSNLRGPFWRDYLDAAGNMQWTWSDEDGVLTNHVAHPLMGAVAGYIQVSNDPKGRYLEFAGTSGKYWQSRLKALAWSAAYSTQFELGPLGEAAIGNVGRIPPKMAMVDLVMTPAGGFGLMLLEDYLDRRFIRRWEQNTSNELLKRFYRIVLNPGRSLANLLRLERPSYRDSRPIEQ